MPITDYSFTECIFFAKETGHISKAEAQQWADQLKKSAESSPMPIVAVIDAMTLTGIHRSAEQIFMQCADTDNLLASIVATNPTASIQAKMLGSSVRRGHTIIVSSVAEAYERAHQIIEREVVME